MVIGLSVDIRITVAALCRIFTCFPIFNRRLFIKRLTESIG